MEAVLRWLYHPTNNYKFDDILDICEKNLISIPLDIIGMKYIHLLCFNGLDNKQIKEYLNTNKIKIVVDEQLIDNIRNEKQHDKALEILNIFSLDSFRLHIDISNVEEYERRGITKYTIHTGYPDVDPIKGRARIGWCICYHRRCKRIFKNGEELVEHLQFSGCYKYNFHKLHETAINEQKLTPEIVLQKDIKHCPSPICDRHDFNTPKELIKHFILLGIEPFWRKGNTTTESIALLDIKEEKNIQEIKIQKEIFRRDVCIACLDIIPEIISFPCRHSTLCINCYKTLTVKKCPECRKEIEKILPY
jgi:hypothetical protein